MATRKAEQEATPRANEALRELLLKDYDYRAHALGQSEAGGETRVDLFIGLLTAVGGGLGYGSWVDPNGWVSGRHQETAVVALSFLLVVGLVTLSKIATRNGNTDFCKFNLDEIRQTFRDLFDDDGVLAQYRPVQGPRFGVVRRFGGLRDTIATLNAALVGALSHVVSLPGAGTTAPTGSLSEPPVEPLNGCLTCLTQRMNLSDCQSWLLALALAGGAFWLQRRWLRSFESHMKQQLAEAARTHVIGVVMRGGASSQTFLMTPALRDPASVVSAQGNVLPGEEHAQATVRSVWESCGVLTRPCGFLLRLPVAERAVPAAVQVKFYLLEPLSAGPSETDSRLVWHTLEAALAELGHAPASKKALSAALAR